MNGMRREDKMTDSMDGFPHKDGHTSVPMFILIPDESLQEFYSLLTKGRLHAEWYINLEESPFLDTPCFVIGESCK